MKRKIFAAALALTLSLLCTACSGGETNVQTTAAPTDAAAQTSSRNGNVYTNNEFGFSITMPEGWYIPTEEAIDEETSEDTALLPLASAYRTEPGISATAADITNITVQAELITQVTDPNEYLTQAEEYYTQLWESQGIEPPIFGGIVEKNIGGQTFYGMDTQFGQSGEEGSFTQEFYLKDMNGYFLEFTIAYQDETGKEQALSAIDSVQFS